MAPTSEQADTRKGFCSPLVHLFDRTAVGKLPLCSPLNERALSLHGEIQVMTSCCAPQRQILVGNLARAISFYNLHAFFFESCPPVRAPRRRQVQTYHFMKGLSLIETRPRWVLFPGYFDSHICCLTCRKDRKETDYKAQLDIAYQPNRQEGWQNEIQLFTRQSSLFMYFRFYVGVHFGENLHPICASQAASSPDFRPIRR